MPLSCAPAGATKLSQSYVLVEIVTPGTVRIVCAPLVTVTVAVPSVNVPENEPLVTVAQAPLKHQLPVCNPKPMG